MNGSLFALIINENMKIYRRRRTWILILLLFLFVVGGAILTNLENQRYLGNEVINTWIFIPISSMGLYSIVALFGVIVASDIVSSEFTWGTIKMLLVRPARRWKVLLSKFIAVVVFGLLLFIKLALASWLIGGLLFGFGGIDSSIVVEQSGEIVTESAGVHVLKLYGLQFISLVITLSVAFMISAVFRSSSLAIGVSIFVVFSGDILTVLLSEYNWGKYLLFPNLSLEQYLVQSQPLIEGMSLSFSFVINTIYFIAFMVITLIVFHQRDVTT